jgi:hypothetical protein
VQVEEQDVEFDTFSHRFEVSVDGHKTSNDEESVYGDRRTYYKHVDGFIFPLEQQV